MLLLRHMQDYDQIRSDYDVDQKVVFSVNRSESAFQGPGVLTEEWKPISLAALPRDEYAETWVKLPEGIPGLLMKLEIIAYLDERVVEYRGKGIDVVEVKISQKYETKVGWGG